MTDGTSTAQPLSAELLAHWASAGDAVNWRDLDPSFGWNIPALSQTDAVGVGLAIQCAAVKARDIAKADMSLYRQQDRVWAEVMPKEHWLARKLRRKPNEFQSWTEFWRMTVMHLELAQNAYVYVAKNRQGDILELVPIMPSRCRERVSSDRRLFYEVNTATEFERAQLGASSLIIPAARMIHLKGKMLDGLRGFSNMQLGSPIFALLDMIGRYQTRLFGNDGRQPLVFEMDGQFDTDAMGEAAWARLRRQLGSASKRMLNDGDPLLLEAGLTAKPIATNPRDAMTVDAYNQQVERICGIMETPPHKIFHYHNVKYDNQSAANAQYANDCLVPIAKNIEEKFRNHLLPEDDWDDLALEFDRMALLAGDPGTVMNILDKALKMGVVELNEARERLPLGLSPIKGGDVRFVPVNMAIVDRDGQIVQQAATGQTQPSGGEDEAEDKPKPEGDE